MNIANTLKVLTWVGLACGGLSILRGRHYTATRPEHPDPTLGAIHYYKGVNGIAYLTDAELWMVHGSFWLGFVIVAGSVLLAFKYSDRRK